MPPTAPAVDALVLLAGTGLLGMGLGDLLGGDGDGDGGADDGDDGADDDVFGDEFGDDVDDWDDEFDDGFDDEFDDDDASAELENRVDELEDELARVSSTMSTVRSENQEIGEAVEAQFGVTVEGVTTMVTPRGEKKATVQLSAEDDAQEIASRIGVF